jgi:hypothetical protein
VPDAPVPVNLRQPDGGSFLHVFDAGSHHAGRPARAPLAHLGSATAHVFVLDPSNLPEVRRRAGSTEPVPHADHQHPSIRVPGAAYEAMIDQIVGYGGRPGRRSLAFVVTHADLLADLSFGLPPHPSETASRRVRAWLTDVGPQNVAAMAELDFRQVRYFLAGPGHPPELPFAWLLSQHRRSVFRRPSAPG